MQPRADLILIRHAPVSEPGRLFGRTDISARIDRGAISALRTRIGPVTRVVSSPALRCRQTTEALFDEHTQDARLWEQDFGDHDGSLISALPDIGVLDSAALAKHTPPNGESFHDVCERTHPALIELGQAAFREGAIALVVHAGVIRAALALVMGYVPGGLCFEIANLSVTRLGCGPDGPLSVSEVNRT